MHSRSDMLVYEEACAKRTDRKREEKRVFGAMHLPSVHRSLPKARCYTFIAPRNRTRTPYLGSLMGVLVNLLWAPDNGLPLLSKRFITAFHCIPANFQSGSNEIRLNGPRKLGNNNTIHSLMVFNLSIHMGQMVCDLLLHYRFIGRTGRL